jgi:hypothetical protein
VQHPKARLSRRWVLRLVLIGAILILLAILIWSQENVLADCGWGADIDAWIDTNANRKWDSGEQPLAGVEVRANDTLNGYQNVAYARSDEQGHGRIFVFIAGCPRARFELRAIAPYGFIFTTPDTVSIPGWGYGSTDPVGFGLIPVKSPPLRPGD